MLIGAMGIGSSVHPSLIHNEFELVIRTAKELEYCLEQLYPSLDTKMGLGEMVRAVEAQKLQPALTMECIKHMKHLNYVRNQLVHERTCNKLEDRARFVEDWHQSEKELHQLLKHHKK